jgi:hypothetical protein
MGDWKRLTWARLQAESASSRLRKIRITYAESATKPIEWCYRIAHIEWGKLDVMCDIYIKLRPEWNVYARCEHEQCFRIGPVGD